MMEESLLPEDLTRKVVSRLPYPHIIQARRLSKLWRRVLSGNSLQLDVKAFGDEVAAVSSSWPSFAPIVKYGKCFHGYDRVGRIWRSITTVSSARSLASMLQHPRESYMTMWSDGGAEGFEHVFQRNECAGSSVCYHENKRKVSTCESDGDVTFTRRIRIVNLITGRFRDCTPPALAKDGLWAIDDTFFHVVSDGFILGHLYSNRDASHLDLALQVLDSRGPCWCTCYLERPDCVFPANVMACPRVQSYSQLVGEYSRLHFYASYCAPSPIVGQYDCSTGQWMCATLANDVATLLSQDSCRLLRCGARVFIVRQVRQLWSALIRVLEYTPSSDSVLTLDDGYEVDADWSCTCVDVSSDEHCIYVAVSEQKRRLTIHSYSLRHGQWEQLPECTGQDGMEFRNVVGSYSPGLNPFMDPAILNVT